MTRSYSRPVQDLFGLYVRHERCADQALERGDIETAIANYRFSLSLNPNNYFLISRLADQVRTDPLKKGYLLQVLDSAVQDMLQSLGSYSSVYHLDRIVSTLNRKIMDARMSVSGSLPFSSIDIDDSLNCERIPKLVLLTCVWGRHHLTEIVLSYYQFIQKQLTGRVELILVAVGSEGQVSRKLCEDCGFNYFEYPNLPLNEKWNFGLGQARAFGADGLVTIGSDDLVEESVFDRYAALLKEGIGFFGFKDAYFVDLSEPSQSIHWHGYGGLVKDNGMPHRLNETIGLARLYSHELLETLNYSLWDGLPINRGLDGRAKQKLIQIGMLPLRYDQSRETRSGSRTIQLGQLCQSMNEMGITLVDLKLHDENVTALSRYKLSKEAYTELFDPWPLLNASFPKLTVDHLRSIAA